MGYNDSYCWRPGIELCFERVALQRVSAFVWARKPPCAAGRPTVIVGQNVVGYVELSSACAKRMHDIHRSLRAQYSPLFSSQLDFYLTS